MNAKGHALSGGLVAITCYLLYKASINEQINFIEVLGVGLSGAVVGLIPDVLEPATNPNHRSLFHSATTLGLLAYGGNKILQDKQLTQNQKAWLVSLGAAYASHLITDCTTPKRIPLLF